LFVGFLSSTIASSCLFIWGFCDFALSRLVVICLPRLFFLLVARRGVEPRAGLVLFVQADSCDPAVASGRAERQIRPNGENY